ncbi:hypothetical protein NHX12_025533 [Muraenolepis orangiensis]|uniref:Uncharacterized protein n=1 Tax=Muraenolepis orangiensis TaxID=630683 RepID=A0A9Q0ITF7_9TELE|nr:hypothetical protein NHX12_025533 [Muraenolepis orangiensis]
MRGGGRQAGVSRDLVWGLPGPPSPRDLSSGVSSREVGGEGDRLGCPGTSLSPGPLVWGLIQGGGRETGWGVPGPPSPRDLSSGVSSREGGGGRQAGVSRVLPLPGTSRLGSHPVA